MENISLLHYEYGSIELPAPLVDPLDMWRYRHLLPLDAGEVRYPLTVGGTPLMPADTLARQVGVERLLLKDETRNPSGSCKDRATALVIEAGLRRGADTITTASTGNAAVSTAVGAASVGMRAVVFVPTTCPPERIAAIREVGAEVFRVRSGYGAAVALSRGAARRFGWLDRNTGRNPLTFEGKKTIALEIWEQLGRAVPDVMVVPVGDGVTLASVAKGFRELVACGVAQSTPRYIGVQASVCQPLVASWQGRPVDPATLRPDDTCAHGIAVPTPAAGDLAVKDVTVSGGSFVAVDEPSLAEAGQLLARHAGVLADPSAAAALAGLFRVREEALVRTTETVVLLVTGRRSGVAAPPAMSDHAIELTDGSLDPLEHLLARQD